MNHSKMQLALQRAHNSRLKAEQRAQASADAAAAKVQSVISKSQQRAADKASLIIRRYLPVTEVFPEAVAIRAYFKAQQRNFAGGDVSEDWLNAEEEILSAQPFGEQN